MGERGVSFCEHCSQFFQFFFLHRFVLYIHEQYIFRKNTKRASIVMKFKINKSKKMSYIAVSRIVSNSKVNQINNLLNESKQSYIAVSIITSNSKVSILRFINTQNEKIIQEIMIVFFYVIKHFGLSLSLSLSINQLIR